MRAYGIAGLIASCVSIVVELPSSQVPDLVVQRGHFSGATAIALSNDDSFLLTAGKERTVRLWEVATGREVRTLSGHSREVTAVAFSSDDAFAISGAMDGEVFLWNILSGSKRNLLESAGNPISSLAISPDGKSVAVATSVDPLTKAVTTTDGHVDRIYRGEMALSQWNLATGRLERQYVFQNADSQNSLTSVAFSPSGDFLAAVGPKVLSVFSTHTGKERMNETFQENAYLSKPLIRFASDTTLLLGSERADTFLFDIASRKLLRRYPGGVTAMAISKDRQMLITGDVNGVMNKWNMATASSVAMTRSGETLPDIVVSSSSRFAFTASDLYNSGTFEIIKIDLETGRESVFGGAMATPFALATTKDGTRAIVAGSEWSLWNLQTGHQDSGRFEEAVRVAALLKNNALLVGTNKGVGFYGADILLPLSKCSPVALNLSRDERYAAVGCSDGAVFSLDLTQKSVSSAELVVKHSRSVASVAISADGNRIVSSGSPGDQELIVWNRATKKTIQLTDQLRLGFPAWLNLQIGHALSHFSPVVILADGKTVIAQTNGKNIMYWNLESGKVVQTVRDEPYWITTAVITPNNRYYIAGTDVGIVEVRDAATGFLMARMGNDVGTAGHVAALASVGSSDRILAGSFDGTVTVWDVDAVVQGLGGGRPIDPVGRFFSFADGSWAVVDLNGRFDSNNLDEIRHLHWVMAEEKLRTYPLEIFMRDYYEPRLLPRLLAGEELPKVRPLEDLNRVQPGVKIVSVKRGVQADLAEVTLEVSPGEGQFQRDGTAARMKTDVYDLRLFREGQLVGQEPELSPEAEASLKNGVVLSAEELKAWRVARRVKRVPGRVELEAKTGTLTRTFTVRLSHGQAGKEIEFTAYAFNEDRVKSETARVSYTVPQGAGPLRRRAYVVAMGVNAYENPGWDLRFAASDAARLQQALVQGLGSRYEVVPVTLISDCKTPGCPKSGYREIGEDHGRKASLHAVLELLAGHALSGELKNHVPPGGEKIQKAEPDDVVVISVSSHGYTSKEGMFYIVPSDSGQTEGSGLTSALRQKWISSDELSAWLRQVDAGEMVMVVDTCHSAATVEEPGFKPGPMGSRGLGQMAYDKGMKILAASQADDVALESEKLKQGLLTYALVHDGLEAKQAMKPGTTRITLDSWLEYGTARVPKLYEELVQGKVQTFAEGSKDVKIDEEPMGGTSTLRKPSAFQQPSLFNFQKRGPSIVLQP